MKNLSPEKHVILLLKNSVNTLVSNPIILYPLCIVVFVQLLVLEIFYFAPRWPLSVFFAPLIRNLWGEPYLHYPFNFQLLPKLFYYAQMPIYLFLGVFVSAMAIAIIAAINNDKRMTLRMAFRKTWPLYIHLFFAAALTLASILLLIKGYNLIFNRALLIRSTSGIYFAIKSVVIHGRPYFNLLMDVFVTTCFLFIVPVIVIEKAKITKAFVSNFKIMRKAFLFLFAVILLPTLLYVPVLLIRSTVAPIVLKIPILQILVIILSVFAKLIIEGVVLTAATTYYLIRREEK